MVNGSIEPNELKSESSLYRILNVIERVGNAVPNPAILFVGLAVIVVVASAIVSNANITVQHPTTNATISAVNLLTIEGLHRILTGLVTNFTSFAPLGTVLTALLGLAVAEASGLIRTSLRLLDNVIAEKTLDCGGRLRWRFVAYGERHRLCFADSAFRDGLLGGRSASFGGSCGIICRSLGRVQRELAVGADRRDARRDHSGSCSYCRPGVFSNTCGELLFYGFVGNSRHDFRNLDH